MEQKASQDRLTLKVIRSTVQVESAVTVKNKSTELLRKMEHGTESIASSPKHTKVVSHIKAGNTVIAHCRKPCYALLR